ncbi:MAG: hypothetical protein WCG23_09505 [bacterium]
MTKKTFEQEIISDEIRKLISDVDRFIVKKDTLKNELSDLWKQSVLGLTCNN